MKQPALRFEGAVQAGGILEITDKTDWSMLLRSLVGKKVWVSVEQWRKIRSNQQNAWYWVGIVPAMATELSRRALEEDPFWNNGLPLSNDETHELLKRAFIGVMTTPLGEVPKSSAGLTTIQFSEYCERIRAFAATEWGMPIPGPSEGWQET